MPDQRLGERIDWNPVPVPSGAPLRGRHVLLRPLDPAADVEPLYSASHLSAGDPTIWTYLPDGPYESPAHLGQTLAWAAGAEGHVYYAIEPIAAGCAQGQASYLRIEPAFGTIEIGHIWFGPELRRTTAATEAIYQLARHAFDDLGYRRLEWKCDALNAASRRAAERFGFRFEGVFRHHQIVKGRNRDTAWFAITDEDWPTVCAGFEAWLAPGNFDAQGEQKRSLAESRG
ncbi:MAG TPA: GNAT family protein [Solirubrobacterales bacterium]|nr:GNAT family protein [Solirubrobacterales bacterium]